MKWFREIFEKSFSSAGEKIKELKARIRQLKDEFRKLLFENVCRSIFEVHKTMFAFYMAVKLHIEEPEDFEKQLQ